VTNIETLAILEAEVVPVLTMDEAVALDREIRDRVASVNDEMLGLQELIDEAKRADLHTPLGFPSWTAYAADVFTVSNELGREQRRELVGYLAGEGMSNRAIAQAVGVTEGTVRNDKVRNDYAPDRPTITVNRTVIDSATGEVIGEAAPPPLITGLDGKTYQPSRPKPQPPTEAQLNAHHETEKLVAEQETLNRWSRAVDSLTNALSYAKTFTPPTIPADHVSIKEFKTRLAALVEISNQWKEEK
jgi:hypothetical protein